jgi:all-trans-retinol 13,14-reductase
MSDSNQFDAIVIGSGIGGLTTAAILSKLNGKKVLLLEQHFVVGGFTQEFKRKGFQWDVGLHYVGGMGEGDTGRAVFDFITEGKLQWQNMPDVYDKFVYPDFTFDVHSDPQHYQSDLLRMFPEERVGLEQYFSDLEKVTRWQGLNMMVGFLPHWFQLILQPLVQSLGKTARQTTKEYLDQHFQDERLKALLTSQWGTYGLPPAQSAFGSHAMVTSSYGKGAWYPVGGAQEIANQILPIIEKTGGMVLTEREVTEIMLEKGIAVGVKARKTHASGTEIEEYYAPVIISDAGAFNTYTKLIPEGYATAQREKITAFPKGYSTLILFLGLKDSPESLGFHGENHWLYTGYDHDQALQGQLASPETMNYCFLSFPSLKDPTAQRHTAEIMTFASYDCFAQWQEQAWRKRDSDYYELKEKIAQNMIHFVENRYPGFKDLIEYSELATPLTVEYFDASDHGAIYGIPWVPERLKQSWIGPETPVKNLYLTGTDALGHGIMGAMMGGVRTAGLLNGPFGFFKVISTIMKEYAARKSQGSQAPVNGQVWPKNRQVENL